MTFAVGVSAPRVSGGGRLYIAPQVVICYLGRVSARISGLAAVQHRHTVVDVYKARLIPFWFNVSAVVDDGEQLVVAVMWSFRLPRLTRALQSAGFAVDLHRTWMYRGVGRRH